MVHEAPPAFAVIDLKLDDGNGLDVVEKLHEVRPGARVVVLTGFGNIATAVAAVKFWRTPALGWWVRVHATLLLISSAIFLGFAWWTHLLAPSLKF